MSNQAQQKPSQNPNQSQGSKPDATKSSWDKDSKSQQTGMKDQSSQPRDQFRPTDASKK